MESILTVAMWLAFGTASAYYAKKQRRNPYVWFFIGLFLGIFGLLLLLMLPLLQRFKNSLHGNQHKTQSTQNTTVTVDLGSSLMRAASQEQKNLMWYYLDRANEQKGPMSFNAFDKQWQEGSLTGATLIWNEHLTEWKVLEELFPNIECISK
ncbi:MAG: DUF4339 domain-containing protein [Chlamydiae bacterium]|nr:DUF4339 domain-containing protein [Chlamydiota bacterium]